MNGLSYSIKRFDFVRKDHALYIHLLHRLGGGPRTPKATRPSARNFVMCSLDSLGKRSLIPCLFSAWNASRADRFESPQRCMTGHLTDNSPWSSASASEWVGQPAALTSESGSASAPWLRRSSERLENRTWKCQSNDEIHDPIISKPCDLGARKGAAVVNYQAWRLVAVPR